MQNLQTVIHDGDLAHHAVVLADRARDGTNNNDTTDSSRQCVVSLFGRLEDGQDICCHVVGYKPTYDLMVLDQSTFMADDEGLRRDLENQLLRKLRYVGLDAEDAVTISAPVFRKSNNGFRDGATEAIVSCQCASLAVFYRVGYQLRDLMEKNKAPFEYRLVNKDASTNPLMRFWGDHHISGCGPSGWYDLSNVSQSLSRAPQTRCDVEVEMSYADLARAALPDKVELNPHFVQMSFDIETFTVDAKTCGIDPLVPGNVCICVGVTLYTDQRGVFLRKCFYHPYDGQSVAAADHELGRFRKDDEEVLVETFATEKAMLEAFGQFVSDIRPDVILGYNSDGFDFWYMYERARVTKCGPAFYNLSKVAGHAPLFLTTSTFQSGARGTITTHRPTIFGIFAMDVMLQISADVTKRYASYSLKNVVKELLKGSSEKYDLPIHRMFAMYKEHTVAGTQEIIHYCMRDVEVTQKVANVDVILNKLVEMSNLTNVDVLTLLARGQTIRCLSLLYAKFTLPEFHYFLDDNHLPDDDIAGGHVGEPLLGLFRDPVVVFDFKSLYPSIMMAYNLDFTSIVHDKQYLDLPHVKYIHTRAIHPVSGRMLEATFAQPADGQAHVIPSVLAALSRRRQAVKKQMKQYDDAHPTRRALDSIQNAIKVTMNSFYGFIGGQKFPIGALAQAITGEGRNLIGRCKVLVETGLPRAMVCLLPRGPEVVYGDTDSVFVHCPGATIEQAEAFGQAVEGFLTRQFTAPIEMEYEKMFLSTVLVKRKNYLYVLKDLASRVKYQGGEQVKRDYCTYFQQAYDVMTHFVLLDKMDEEVRIAWSAFKKTEACQRMLRFLETCPSVKAIMDDMPCSDNTGLNDYVAFTAAAKTKALTTLNVLDQLSKKSASKLEEERDARLAFQPLPVLENDGSLKIAQALRYKQAFYAATTTTTTTTRTTTTTLSKQLLLDALSLLHMYIERLRQTTTLDEATLETLTSSCKLNGKYDSPLLAKARGVDKAAIGPYAREDWAIPNNGAIHLARRIKARDPGQEPSVGERFSFLAVLDLSRADVKTQQLETVEYAVANKLPIDLNAYLEKNGMPFQKLLGVIGGGFACGAMLTRIMKEINNEVNDRIRLHTTAASNAAKRQFFAKKNADAPDAHFKPRQVKTTKAVKAELGHSRSITDFFKR